MELTIRSYFHRSYIPDTRELVSGSQGVLDFIVENPQKTYRNWLLQRRGYPSLVKGAGFRVPSRRRSQVQLLLHAFIIRRMWLSEIAGSGKTLRFFYKDFNGQ